MGVIVTGGSGFIGSYLLKELPEAVNIDLKNGNDILKCDLPDADIVIHLAAEPGVIKSMEEPYSNAETNILGTIRLLNRYRTAKFIFSSSGGTIQETIESPYGLSKYTCEQYIKMLHDNYVILRFPNIYGKGSRSVVDKFLNQEKNVIYGDGSANRTYAHVSDVVNAITRSMAWPKGLYKLGSNQNYTVEQIAEYVGKPYEYSDKRPGELDHSWLDNDARGWYPTIELKDYIQDVIGNNS